MALVAHSEHRTHVCCAVCSNFGLWGWVAVFQWEYVDLEPVHVCPQCLAYWKAKSTRLQRIGCQSWDMLEGHGSKQPANIERGYVALDVTPYLGASLMRTLWNAAGINTDRKRSTGLVVLWMMNRGQLKQRRQSAGR